MKNFASICRLSHLFLWSSAEMASTQKISRRHEDVFLQILPEPDHVSFGIRDVGVVAHAADHHLEFHDLAIRQEGFGGGPSDRNAQGNASNVAEIAEAQI